MTSTDLNTKVECTQPLIKAHGDMRWRQMGNTMHVKGYIGNDAISGDGNRVVLGRDNEVLVFDFDGTSWSEVASFTNINRPWQISLSGDGKTLAFGTLGDSSESERVEIYQYNEEKRWKNIGNVSVRGLRSVSLSGNGSRIAIHGIFDGQELCGVRIFQYVSDEILKEIWQNYTGSSDWSALVKEFLGDRCQQIGQTFNFYVFYDDWLGMSLSSDGSVVAVKQILNTGEHKDTIQVFRYSSGKGQWIQVGQTIHGNGQFYISEKISLNAKGNIMAFGAHEDDLYHHYVQVYSFDGNQWNKISNISIEYKFHSLSLSSNGNTIAVYSYEKNDALTFKYDGNDWVPMKICGQPKDNVSSVSLSSDGNRLAVLF